MVNILGFEVDILTFIVLFPLVGAALVVLLPREVPNLARGIALGISLIVLVPTVAVFVLTQRDNLGPNQYAFESSQEWFKLMGSSWHLGVDGISATMMLLTALLAPVAILIAYEHDDRVNEVMALFLFMETGMLGVFGALDMMIFFLFYEVGLVPMYFIIYLWGGDNRDYAARKFFIFTMAGSLGLLLTIQLIAVVVGKETGVGTTFDIPTWLQIWPQLSTKGEILGFGTGAIKWLAFLGFTLAFALKIPIWPLHTWLPDAHTEAPTAGSMLLAGVLLKLGAYGFIRLVIPLFPLEWVETRQLSPFGLDLPFHFQATQLLALLATISIVFGAFSAWAQDDFKKLIAYSSVNHMGFVALGFAVFAAIYGSTYAMSLPDRPDLVLSSFGNPMVQEDVDHFLGAGRSLDNLATKDRRLVSYYKLIDEYQAEIACGDTRAAPLPDNVNTCTVVNIPHMAKDTQAATIAANGAVMQMFNHGLSAAGMFLLVGALYHKAHTRDLRRFGGLWHIVPAYSTALVFTSMASLGLPGLNGFIGEFLVISGSFPVRGFQWFVLVGMIGLLITGAYILKGLQKVLHGPVNEEWKEYHEHHHSLEISRREVIALAPLAVLMLVTGVYPNWVLPLINHSVGTMLAAVKLVGG